MRSDLFAAARQKLSPAWVTIIAGTFVVFIAGNFQYGFGAFVKPLANNFGWSRAAISGCVTVKSIMGAIASPIAGALGDKYGTKRIIIIGIFLVGAGYLLGSRIQNLWQLYVSLGVLTGIGVSALFVPMIRTATKWFGTKSALANGIILSGFSWTQIVTPPLATYLILNYGWETCFIFLGIAALVLGTAAWSFIKTPPKTVQQPVAERDLDNQKHVEEYAEAQNDHTFSEAIRTPAFWFLFLIIFIIAACYQMIAIHIIAAAIDRGVTWEAAALILTLSGITNTAGRLALGGIASVIGNKKVLILSTALQAVTLFFLVGAHDLYVFYIVAAIYGLGYGGVTPITATLTGTFFGTKSMGSIFGTVNSAYTLGAAFGPLIGGYIFDITGNYNIAFISIAVATSLAFLLSLILKPPSKKALTV
jgi:MFS family permease